MTTPEQQNTNSSVTPRDVGAPVDVEAAIMEIRGRLTAMGNNDSEMGTLDNILEAWRKKDITSQEALARANAVFESKMER